MMRYVAEEDGSWVALVGFGSAALCVRPREELLSWSDHQRYRILRYVTNNQRFCVLDEHRRQNLASQVLAMTPRRDALRLLVCEFDPPALLGEKPVRAADLKRLGLKTLLDELAAVPDPRMRRGIRHQLPQILAIAVLATLRGATSLFAIGELARVPMTVAATCGR